MRIRQVLLASGATLAVVIATIGTATAEPGQGLSSATTNADRATALSPGGISAAVRDADAEATDLVPVLWMLKTKDDEVRQALDGQLADTLAGRQPQFLSAAQIAERFGGSESDIATVGGYLQGKDYQPALDATHSFFQTQMTAAQIAAELLTTMGLYHMDVPGAQPVQFLAADQAPTVPAPVANSVTGVTGLRTAPVPTAALTGPSVTVPQVSPTLAPPNVRTGTPQGCAAAVGTGSFTPNQLLTAYGIDKLHQAGVKGEGTRVAIVSVTADPGSFTGFTACYPEIFGSPAQINGRVNYHAGAAGPATGEGDLDLQAISMSVPNAERIDFFAALEPWEQTLALSQLIDPASYPDGRLPDVVSFSMMGGFEGPGCSGGLDANYTWLTRDYLVAAVHRTALTGVTMVYSSGDGGGYSTQTCSVFVPNDSPYVTSVGGTNLWLNPDNTIRAQGPWNRVPGGPQGAGGGGASQVFTNPFSPTSPPQTLTPSDWPNFQDGVPAAHGGLATSTRLLPDVSAFAAALPGETLNLHFPSGDSWGPGFGTSFAAPFFAGSVALVAQKAGRPLGQLNGYLYRAARSNAGADYSRYFYDITEGNTKLITDCCDAGRGYDQASGLGSVKFDAFADFVALPPLGPPADPAAPATSQVQSTSTGPIGGCVTVGRRIPANGTRRLMKPGCATNAGQKVGVSVGAQPRGDMHFYTLFCQTSNGHTTKTRPTGYGNSSRYCKKGALKIRTNGQHLRIRVTWSSPAVGAYLAFNSTHTYKT